MMAEKEPNGAGDGGQLPKRMADMDLSDLGERLAALDNERARSGSDPQSEALSAARAALERARAVGASPQETAEISERQAALDAIEREVQQRLGAAGARDLLAQGLRLLEDALYTQRDFSRPGDLPAEVSEALDAFDASFPAVQAQARELITARSGLAMMPDQTGIRIDPEAHNVVGSRTTDDPARDNTVAAQEAPGWVVGGDVLVRADVVRYASGTGGAPMLPSLDDIGRDRLDDSLLGRKKDS